MSSATRGRGGADSYFKVLTGPQREIAVLARKIILSVDKKFKEKIMWAQPAYFKKDIVCYIAVYKDHVNIGFFRGAEFSEKCRALLEGSGLHLRHMKIYSITDLNVTELKTLVKEGIKVDATQKEPEPKKRRF